MEVSLEKKNAVVTGGEEMDLKQLENAVTEAGYEVTGIQQG